MNDEWWDEEKQDEIHIYADYYVISDEWWDEESSKILDIN